jgi:hypothetical protein
MCKLVDILYKIDKNIREAEKGAHQCPLNLENSE